MGHAVNSQEFSFDDELDLATLEPPIIAPVDVRIAG